jgi:hypothetical protein
VRHAPGLVHGVGPVLGANRDPRFRMREAGHVAQREDMSRAGRREVRVADDAVLDDQPGAAQPLIVGDRADADDHRSRPQRRSVEQRNRQIAGPPADRPHADPESGGRPLATVQVGQERAHQGPGRALERDARGVDQGHLAAGRARRRRRLGADEAAADHHDHPALGEALLERETVRQRAELVDARFWPPRGWPRRGPGRDHEIVVGQQITIGQQDLPGIGGNRRGWHPQAQLDAVGRRVLRGEQGRPLRRPRAGQHLLGERRPVAGRPRLVSHQGDGAVVTPGAQRLGHPDTSDRRAHDDNPVPHDDSLLAGLDGPWPPFRPAGLDGPAPAVLT